MKLENRCKNSGIAQMLLSEICQYGGGAPRTFCWVTIVKLPKDPAFRHSADAVCDAKSGTVLGIIEHRDGGDKTLFCPTEQSVFTVSSLLEIMQYMNKNQKMEKNRTENRNAEADKDIYLNVEA